MHHSSRMACVMWLMLLLLLPFTSAFAPMYRPAQLPASLPRPPPLVQTRMIAPIFRKNASSDKMPTGEMDVKSDTTEETTKFRRLKDLMWVRETLEDLTASEFACSIDAKPSGKKRAIDYDNLLNQLDRRIMEMACEDSSDCEMSFSYPALTPGTGMATIVYTEAQRDALLERILKIRAALMETMKGHMATEEVEEQKFSIPLPELKIPKEDDDTQGAGPKLYVRDDGTVDWDGALQDRDALRNFGTAVWARINGQNPEFLSEDELQVEEVHGSPKPVTVKIDETDEIKREKALLDLRRAELRDLEIKHTALLNSALTAGQAVANINLATLDPSLRNKIRSSSDGLEKKSEEISYQAIIYDLERIYTYLSGEISNQKGYVPLQDRLNVAEFGLLESQVEGFSRLLQIGEGVDADVLAVVRDQVMDFKRRLGIDYYVTGVTFDQEAIRRWVNDLFQQGKTGVAFYVKGCELFWNDILFSLSLIGRALQGYTLKPREVRNLRRTFKDIVTFIPVVIILIIPLTPIGHVLVFGAIQRFFPDFFPSCFTEQRQNLLSLYESTEYTEVKIDESWRDKLARVASAFLFLTTKIFNSVVFKLNEQFGGNQSGVENVNGKSNGDDVNGSKR